MQFVFKHVETAFSNLLLKVAYSSILKNNSKALDGVVSVNLHKSIKFV